MQRLTRKDWKVIWSALVFYQSTEAEAFGITEEDEEEEHFAAIDDVIHKVYERVKE